MSRVLIVEDEASLASAIAILVRRLGHEATSAASAAMGFERLLQDAPDVVVLDIGLPDENGLATLARMREVAPRLPVLVITAHGSLQNAVEARKRGADAYLVKPLDLGELERTLQVLLQSAVAEGPALAPEPDVSAPFLIGSAPAMQPAFAAIAHATASDAPVLLTGPTGIGKSLAARLIHLHSARHRGPFVTLSCASLPESLLEAELFGHEKGSFTGAQTSREGHLDRAAGGTLFLDEIGDVPLTVQVKLLRVVEDKVFHRVGGREDVHVDLRIVAATNHDLAAAVRERRFREDLYYRLRVLEVALPPLRDRKGDVPALANFLLAQLAGERRLSLSPDALRLLQAHDWPGNVRELRNVLERAAAVCAGDTILPTHLPPDLLGAAAAPGVTAALDAALDEWIGSCLAAGTNYDDLLQELEGRLLQLLLPRFDHKPTHLARALAMNRATLRKRLRALGQALPPDDGD